MTIKLACLFTAAAIVAATPARAFQGQGQGNDETYEPEIQPDATPLDFPYTPPPDPAYDQAADQGYGAPQITDVGYDGVLGGDYVDGYDDGYSDTAYQGFEETLSPYGNWIDGGSHGRVWVPAVGIVGADFTPYFSGGYFVLTEYGWTWLSHYQWGWAPFHYGRWIVLAGYGWAWVPGTLWAPAWVTWRWCDGYVGWAPAPPRGLTAAAAYGAATSAWRFLAASELGSRRPRYVPTNTVPSIFKRTTLVTNDLVLKRGGWSGRINAGPVRVARAAPVRLAEVAPRSLPRQAIVPRPRAAQAGGFPPAAQARTYAPGHQGGAFAPPPQGSPSASGRPGAPAARPFAGPAPSSPAQPRGYAPQSGPARPAQQPRALGNPAPVGQLRVFPGAPPANAGQPGLAPGQLGARPGRR